MNISLKPHILISHFIPGFVFIVMSFSSYMNWKINLIVATLKDTPNTNIIIVSFVSIIIAFLIGEVFDSLRDLLEEFPLNKIFSEVNWDFFFNADKEKIEKLNESYFTWYVFNLNSSLSLIGALLFTTLFINNPPFKIWAIVVIASLILFIDGIILRKEIAKHTK